MPGVIIIIQFTGELSEADAARLTAVIDAARPSWKIRLNPPAAIYDAPGCVECGAELTGANAGIGEAVCLDCLKDS